jgi:hypothetical protein
VAFSTVFQAFLTTFLIDSGYKKPIKNMDELYESGIKLCYPSVYDYFFENGDETGLLNVKRNFENVALYVSCYNSSFHLKNSAVLFTGLDAESLNAKGVLLNENSEPSLCKLEDGEAYNDGLRMLLFHGDPLLHRVNKIVDRVFEASLYNYWISRDMNWYKLHSRKIAIVHPLDGYYSFNLYHMQPAFYLLLMGWCLSALCFVFELFYNCVLNIRV